MMKSGVPWSISGIDDDIREAARAAARRSGVSVSEWLNDLIARQAAAQGITPSRSHDSSGGEEPDMHAVAEAVQRVTHRIRSMDQNSRAALSGLQGRLDEIAVRLEAAADPGRRGSERARSLKGVATMVDQLSREIDNADETARSAIEGLRARTTGRAAAAGPDIDRVADAIRNLDARISSMGDRVRSGADEPSANLDAVKARLESLLARTPERPASRVAALDATLRSLETHIDQARDRLAAVARRPSPMPSSPLSMSAGDEERIRRIEGHLAEMTGVSGPGPAAPSSRRGGDLDSAVAEISARQRSIDDRADYAALARDQRHVVDSLASLRSDVTALADRIGSSSRGVAGDEATYIGLARRLDALAAERPLDRDLLSAMRVELEALRTGLDGNAGLARLEAVGEEIAAIRRALESDDSPRAIARLEMRVAELARGVEAALNASNSATRRGEADSVARLESRLDEIAARIEDFLGRATPAEAMSGLTDRLSRLADRLERVGNARQEPAVALDEIKSEIVAIRREIAGRPVPKVDHLESQIAELASRLDSATRSESEGQALAELEAQVAHIASELERSMPRTATLKQVEDNLARLQSFLSDNRQESVEAARSAAREAVREIAAAPGDSELVKALKGDLENIRAAASDADQRTQDTLGSVHETLARVVERLTRLEHEAGEPAPEMAREPMRATGTYGAPPPVARAASDAAASVSAAAPRLPEDNRPLEPGSGKPDLAALRELARAASEGQRDKKSDRKADFIAAARRAAQAAAAEAASDTVEEEAPGEEGKPGAFARIGQAIRKRKRPLLLAAAALVLAISALHLFGERGIGKRIGLSPETAAVERSAGDIPAAPFVANVPAGEARPAPTAPQASRSALVAPPGDPPSAIAFAAPDGIEARFGDMSTAPPTTGFTPAPPPSAPATAGTVAAAPAAEAPPVESTVVAGEPMIGPQKLQEAAAGGDPSAAFEVAARYAEGNGVDPDLAKAAEWYRRAAEAGVAVAQYRLGSLYERGQGVARDRTEAVTWYQRAADQGNVGAMHNLAVMMSEGVDGAPDHGKAFEWFLAAANCGVKDSQYNLGVIYARGLGPAQDLVESYKWFAVAAAAGDKDAGARRDEVAKVLSPDDLAKARAAVTAWRARPAITEANTVATPPGGWGGTSSVTEADRRALVKKIQTLLAEQGYDPGPLDGYAGPQTEEAVKAFQRKIGVSQNGQISGDLVAALTTPQT